MAKSTSFLGHSIGYKRQLKCLNSYLADFWLVLYYVLLKSWGDILYGVRTTFTIGL